MSDVELRGLARSSPRRAQALASDDLQGGCRRPPAGRGQGRARDPRRQSSPRVESAARRCSTSRTPSTRSAVATSRRRTWDLEPRHEPDRERDRSRRRPVAAARRFRRPKPADGARRPGRDRDVLRARVRDGVAQGTEGQRDRARSRRRPGREAVRPGRGGPDASPTSTRASANSRVSSARAG